MFDIHIYPEYEKLRDWIAIIPSGEYSRDRVYCDSRNLVTKSHYTEQDFVIKQFRRVTFANRLIYSCIRKNKAERSAENAERLLSYGIMTAKPVAFIVKKKLILYQTSWYISEYLPYPTLGEYVNMLGNNLAEKTALFGSFTDFCFTLFQKKIYFRDFNTGNFLVNKTDEGYNFYLVDINRIKWGRCSCKKQILAFEKLQLSPEDISAIVSNYARRAHKNEDLFLSLTFFYKLLFQDKRKLKKKFKRLFCNI